MAGEGACRYVEDLDARGVQTSGGVAEDPYRSEHRKVAMRKKCLALLLVTILSSTWATPRTVAELTIDAVGASQPDVEETCKSFKPTPSQIKRFFLRAYPVEGHVITTDRYSPCYAKGKIRFSDNSKGNWWLYSGGTAVIKWNRGGSVDLLYKQNNGWHDPFAGSYGLCDEGEC
jgi:hypothetical protein